MPNIVLIQSKPGLGKTLLAKTVVEALNKQGITADHFSMGDKLRGMFDGTVQSRFTGELQKYRYELSHHLPVPDAELTADIAGEFCEQSAARGVQVSVIDGYPRYPHLLPAFHRIVNEYQLNVILLVVLDGSDELATSRIIGRDRQALGQAENAVERLQSYAKISAPVVEGLAKEYQTLRIDASNELGKKCDQVVVAIQAALAT